MNNDLISREALKKDFEERNKACDKWIANAKDEETKIRADATKRFICEVIMTIDNAPTVKSEKAKESEIIKAYTKGFDTGVETVKNERPQGGTVIKCQDCKYRVKEWREDKRMKEKGYWVYGCKHFGEIMGYWGFGGNDNEFCSDAERKDGAE